MSVSKIKRKYIFCLLSFIHTTPFYANTLTIEQYIETVMQNNKSVQNSREVSEAAKIKANDGNLQFTPVLFATGQYSMDKREPQLPGAGPRTDIYTGLVGVSQQTDFGLQAELSYTLNWINQFDTNPFLVKKPDNYMASPQIKLTQSLWKNGFGIEQQTSREIINSQSQLISMAEHLKIQMIAVEAESAYWRLAMARATVAKVKETLARTEKMRDWHKKRQNLELADRADYLQANAAVLARKLELKTALDEEELAVRQFNSIRSADENQTVGALQEINDDLIKSIKVPNKLEEKQDIKIAKEQIKIANLSSELSEQKFEPTLDVFLTANLNGKDYRLYPTVNESATTQFPYTAVGIKFSMPLDSNSIKTSLSAHTREIKGAEINLEKRIYENNRNWQDLQKRYEDIIERLQLVEEIIKAQKEKLEYERDRLRRGRTVTYQVLIFEQDYSLAELSKLKIQAEMLGVVTQMKMFSPERGAL